MTCIAGCDKVIICIDVVVCAHQPPHWKLAVSVSKERFDPSRVMYYVIMIPRGLSQRSIFNLIVKCFTSAHWTDEMVLILSPTVFSSVAYKRGGYMAFRAKVREGQESNWRANVGLKVEPGHSPRLRPIDSFVETNVLPAVTTTHKCVYCGQSGNAITA